MYIPTSISNTSPGANLALLQDSSVPAGAGFFWTSVGMGSDRRNFVRLGRIFLMVALDRLQELLFSILSRRVVAEPKRSTRGPICLMLRGHGSGGGGETGALGAAKPVILNKNTGTAKIP